MRCRRVRTGEGSIWLLPVAGDGVSAKGVAKQRQTRAGRRRWRCAKKAVGGDEMQILLLWSRDRSYCYRKVRRDITNMRQRSGHGLVEVTALRSPSRLPDMFSGYRSIPLLTIHFRPGSNRLGPPPTTPRYLSVFSPAR